MKKLEFKVAINAPREKVWNTMIQPDTYKEWTAASWPGSFYKGQWQQEHTLDFISEDGSGTRVLLKEVHYPALIRSQHVALLQTGSVADTTSDVAKNWIGTTEDYNFTERDGATELVVSLNAEAQWEKMFDEGFPPALNKLKEICERA
ncbi:MAG TPA: SRPBCC domain-containing protein [Flavisolibacter sp.]|jgi:uncharacterized protein YndB with AHSA1/START domain|nr:SRPBCC domain-containing protein [Flavisolibacter sp.]